MDITLRDIYQELRDLRKDLNEFKESQIRIESKVDALHLRVDRHEQEIREIRESLVGNVTAKSMKQWIIGAASVMAAVTAIFGMLLKILN